MTGSSESRFKQKDAGEGLGGMGKRILCLPSWRCGLLEATLSGLQEHLATVGALWLNGTAAFGADGGECDNPTHTLEGGQCRGDRAVSTPLAQSLEQEHLPTPFPNSCVPVCVPPSVPRLSLLDL